MTGAAPAPMHGFARACTLPLRATKNFRSISHGTSSRLLTSNIITTNQRGLIQSGVAETGYLEEERLAWKARRFRELETWQRVLKQTPRRSVQLHLVL
jgi:hypothetical protein